MVTIVGGGVLGGALNRKLQNFFAVDWIKRPDIDLEDISRCGEYADILKTSNTVIFVAGTADQDSTKTFNVNAIAPIKIIESLHQQGWQGHVIVTGSSGATWTSWPGADLTRLAYNNSKRLLREWCFGYNQSQSRNIYITVIDPCRFESPMSDWTGYSADTVAEVYVDLLTNKNPLVQHIEMLNAINHKAD